MRRTLSTERFNEIAAKIQNTDYSLARRSAERLKAFLEEEDIIKKDGSVIPAWRTITAFPDIYAEGEKETLQKGHYIHEQGRMCNISSDWDGLLTGGLMPKRCAAEENLKAGVGDADFLCAAIITIDSVIAYADRYENEKLSAAVRDGAKDFVSALQLFRILHFSLWASGAYHNTVGRFDQYMWKYLKADLESGAITEEKALEVLKEFFLSFNRDSDLYTGMQQGDNGQSLMLGGCDREGNCAVNRLTYLCLEASLYNHRIDPKINLRVDKNTPIELYEKCTMLTKQGLGFPQYSNDDVVIPALVKYGYSLEDARDYTVAACWEFIIPGIGMDIPNIGAISIAAVVDRCIREHLSECDSFDALFEIVKNTLRRDSEALAESLKNLWMEPAPYQSVLMTNCVERGHDISEGSKYNNYGIHGTGVAEAVDQLMSIKTVIFDEKKLTAEEFLGAMNRDFDGEEELLHYLRTESPRMGRDDTATEMAERVLNAWADSLEGLVNERGGVFRAGTGSAMYYVWHANELGTLADGHLSSEMLPANFSPSLLMANSGPLSVIKAFSLSSLSRVCNGGPLTLELHDTVFRNEEGISKVAALVRSFILMGGHQLQLNAISRETLIAARENPENYGHLIVRVWGWSGHFVQLDTVYQDQIIARTSYAEV